jgi:sec-independent protein translocase protein TatA
LVPLALFNLGPWEITLIVILALLLFGGKRLPSLAKDLGNGIKEFRRSISSATEDDHVETTPNKSETIEQTKSRMKKKS